MSFDPLTLSPFLWFDASQIAGLSNNDPVAQWDDLSGNSRHLTQATEGLQPTYLAGERNGLPVVRFDSDYMETAAFSLTTAMTFFLVCRIRETANGFIVFDGIGSSNRRAFGSTASDNQNLGMWAGIGTGPISGVGAHWWHTHTGIFNGNSSLIRKAGVQIDTGNPGSNNWGGLRLGRHATDTGRFGQVDVAEFLVYPSVLSSSDIADVEAYLRQKWHRLNASTISVALAEGPSLPQSLAEMRQTLDEVAATVVHVPAGELGVHDFDGYDALVVMPQDLNDAVTNGPLIRGLIDGGLPTLLSIYDFNQVGGGLWENTAAHAHLIGTSRFANATTSANIAIVDNTHPITSGFALGDLAVWMAASGAQAGASTIAGVALANARGFASGAFPGNIGVGLGAIEVGTPDLQDTPQSIGARVVLVGFLRTSGYTEDGREIIRRSVDWLVEKALTPTGAVGVGGEARIATGMPLEASGTTGVGGECRLQVRKQLAPAGAVGVSGASTLRVERALYVDGGTGVAGTAELRVTRRIRARGATGVVGTAELRTAAPPVVVHPVSVILTVRSDRPSLTVRSAAHSLTVRSAAHSLTVEDA